MTDKEYQDLADFRIQRAKDTLKEAALVIEHCMWNAAANRLYYASFYAVTALLIKHRIETYTHAGARQMFGLHFIKPGLLDIEITKTYNRLFQLRQAGDYQDYADIDPENIIVLTEPTKSLIAEIEKLVRG